MDKGVKSSGWQASPRFERKALQGSDWEELLCMAALRVIQQMLGLLMAPK